MPGEQADVEAGDVPVLGREEREAEADHVRVPVADLQARVDGEVGDLGNAVPAFVRLHLRAEHRVVPAELAGRDERLRRNVLQRAGRLAEADVERFSDVEGRVAADHDGAHPGDRADEDERRGGPGVEGALADGAERFGAGGGGRGGERGAGGKDEEAGRAAGAGEGVHGRGSRRGCAVSRVSPLTNPGRRIFTF